MAFFFKNEQINIDLIKKELTVTMKNKKINETTVSLETFKIFFSLD